MDQSLVNPAAKEDQIEVTRQAPLPMIASPGGSPLKFWVWRAENFKDTGAMLAERRSQCSGMRAARMGHWWQWRLPTLP